MYNAQFDTYILGSSFNFFVFLFFLNSGQMDLKI